MINAIINGIFSIVQWAIAIVLAPIDLLLANIPYLSEAAQGVSDFRTFLQNGLYWVLDFQTPAFRGAITAFVLAWIFFANTSFAVHSIKVAFKWLQKIKFW